MSFIKPSFSLLIALAITAFSKIQAQQNYIDKIPGDTVPSIRILDINPRFFRNYDTVWRYSGICKTLKIVRFTGQGNDFLQDNTNAPHQSFLTVHGNIQYDFLYRSFADTPFFQKDFRQHTIQSSLTVTVKDRYPFHVNLVVRKSNSPFFKNFFDGGVLFDRFSYYKNIKKRLITRIAKQIPGQSYLDPAKALLEKQIEKYNALKSRMSTNGLAQRLIEEREKIYYRSLQSPSANLPGKINTAIDSLTESLAEQVNKKRKELDSLQNNISRFQLQVDSMKNKIANDIALAGQKINKAGNPKELAKVSGEYGLAEKKEKGEKFISDLKNIGIGRTVLNYSELTARNVSLTGLNLEYNPGLYVAVAAGKIDYGFKGFFGRKNRSPNQHLLKGRVRFFDIYNSAK